MKIGSHIVTDGLIFYVDAANTNSYIPNNTIVDSMISEFTGSLINDVTFVDSSSGCWEFDGIGDRIDFEEASNSSFTSSLDPQLNSYTANLFFEIDIDSATQVIVSKGNASSNRIGWLMYYNPTYDTVYMRCCGEDLNNSQRVERGYNIDKDIIYMATLVIDREQDKFFAYLNGKNPSGGSTSIAGFGSIVAPKKLLLGIRDDNALALKGNIYLAQIYNRALSPKEVLQNYNALKGRFN